MRRLAAFAADVGAQLTRSKGLRQGLQQCVETIRDYLEANEVMACSINPVTQELDLEASTGQMGERQPKETWDFGYQKLTAAMWAQSPPGRSGAFPEARCERREAGIPGVGGRERFGGAGGTETRSV